MIKKINILLILISIIISLYYVFVRDDNVVLVLKDLSIVLTINAIYILNKLFKLKISEELNFIYIFFVFLAHFLGVICELYNYIYCYDKVTHFISGIVSSFVAIYILEKFDILKKRNLIFNILFIISFSLMIASIWEIFEYLASFYLGVDPQKVITTGVTDTMLDIIVACLGAILVSLSYYYEYGQDENFIVKKFIKML